MRVARLAGLGLALALTLAAPAGGKPPLDPKDPDAVPAVPGAGALRHDQPGQVDGRALPPPLVGPGPFKRLPSIDDTGTLVVLTRDKPYWQAGTLDPVLTNACRLGDFVTAAGNRMVARFTGKEGVGVLQVVVPTHRHLLYDRRALAKPSETYFFLDSGYPSCQVWIDGKTAKPRVLDPKRGTSLPPPDPQALNKKLNRINGWPSP